MQQKSEAAFVTVVPQLRRPRAARPRSRTAARVEAGEVGGEISHVLPLQGLHGLFERPEKHVALLAASGQRRLNAQDPSVVEGVAHANAVHVQHVTDDERRKRLRFAQTPEEARRKGLGG